MPRSISAVAHHGKSKTSVATSASTPPPRAQLPGLSSRANNAGSEPRTSVPAFAKASSPSPASFVSRDMRSKRRPIARIVTRYNTPHGCQRERRQERCHNEPVRARSFVAKQPTQQAEQNPASYKACAKSHSHEQQEASAEAPGGPQFAEPVSHQPRVCT